MYGLDGAHVKKNSIKGSDGRQTVTQVGDAGADNIDDLQGCPIRRYRKVVLFESANPAETLRYEGSQTCITQTEEHGKPGIDHGGHNPKAAHRKQNSTRCKYRAFSRP